ncbi:hypothetical protein B6U80_02610 [Candidatus Pacearchaeota archaeon ex4484_26]|nr:MAG: hypothetical protein B6U80_02610 [Candidatus Pacearchaeota archaeon ex4484_26]
MEQEKNFTITKKVAKHGNQAVIVIPSFLQQELKPRSIVEVKIKVIKEAKVQTKTNKKIKINRKRK